MEENPVSVSQPANIPTAPEPVGEQPVPHEIPKKSNKKSWIIGLLFLGLIIVVAYLYYQNTQLKQELEMVIRDRIMVSEVATPTLDPMAEWKTYSTDYYQIMYPASWPVPTETLLSTSTEVNLNDQITINSGVKYSQDLQRNYTMDEFVSMLYLSNDKADVQKIYIAGHGATKVEQTTILGASEVNIFIPHLGSDSDGFLIITYNKPEDSQIDTISQILSTFKFTPLSLDGKLVRMTRPDPGIPYDYELQLSEPYYDELDARGRSFIYSIIVVPSSDLVKRQLENSVNKNVTLGGDIEWGLAETRHFKVISVEN